MNKEIKEILELQNKIDKIKNDTYTMKYTEWKAILDYITNLQEENQKLKNDIEDISCSHFILFKSYEDYKSRCEKAIEYITSYEAISTIQGLDKIEQNKKLDERTMNVMVERYLKVHHNLLNKLQGEDKELKGE